VLVEGGAAGLRTLWDERVICAAGGPVVKAFWTSSAAIRLYANPAIYSGVKAAFMQRWSERAASSEDVEMESWFGSRRAQEAQGSFRQKFMA